jgi:hypothetical protein
MSAKRYTLLLLCLAGCGLALTGAVNRIVDPFWYFRDIEIDGLNAVKTKFRWYERHVKPAIVLREQPDALVFGSSYAEVGFDPRNPAFTAGGTLRGFNFAIAGALWRDTYCYVQYALERTRVKRIVLGAHPGALPAHDCEAALAEMRGPGLGELLLSATALRASISTVLEQRQDPASHTREGLYFYARGAGETERHFRDGLRVRLNGSPRCRLNRSEREAPGLVAPTGAQPTDLSGLVRIIRAAQQRGIELRVVFYPAHVYALEVGVQCGDLSGVWEALRQTAALLETDASGAKIDVWEFFGYNEVTGERVSNGMRYWQDPEHFNHELGDLILDQMFAAASDGAPSVLGRRVTTQGVEERIARFASERSAFIRSHAWFYSDLRALAPPDRWSE